MISAELYEQINQELVSVIEKYQSDLTQYDMLIIAVNLIICYIDVVIKYDDIPKHKIIDEVINLIQTRDRSNFMSSTGLGKQN